MFTKPVLAALMAATVTWALFADGVAAYRSAPAASASEAGAARAADRDALFSRERLHLVLRDGTDVRLRGGKLVSLSGKTDTSRLQSVLDGVKGLRVERLVHASEADLAATKRQAEKRSGKKAPDLNLDFLVVLPKGTDADAVVDQLASLELVEAAYREPLPTSPPTADFSGRQGYRTPAPDGINVAAAAGNAGGSGSRVRIIDIEGGWNPNHEDLAKARGQFIANGIPSLGYPDHGTAVLGEMIGTKNGFGVTGIAPDAGIGMINAWTTSGNALANAIYLGTQHLQAGDVMLLEVHFPSARSRNDGTQYGFMPAEYWDAFYKQIRTATAMGIIVVEAAGNGYQNLDDPFWGSLPFPQGKPDSGAIMVGAGQAPGCGTEPARSRKDFSNFGSRVDLQGWGECVATTGYGDLQNIANAEYTKSFSGTSSASPIVAGAAAVMSSIIETRTGTAAAPAQIRTLLKNTGTAQVFGTGALTGKIGPMPDLARAIKSITGTSDTTAPVVVGPSQAAATNYQLAKTDLALLVPTRITWSATDASGISAYAVKVSVNGEPWTTVTLPTPTSTNVTLNLTPGNTYSFTVAARDGAGIWSAWKTGPVFRPATLSEIDPGVTYSTGWVRAAYAPAAGGYVKVSGTPGAWARLTFTGRNVAWVGTKATNRGQADVWLDGTYVGRLDLYRATTLERTILFSRNVTTTTTHTLDIQVVGTAARPKVDIDGFVILK